MIENNEADARADEAASENETKPDVPPAQQHGEEGQKPDKPAGMCFKLPEPLAKMLAGMMGRQLVPLEELTYHKGRADGLEQALKICHHYGDPAMQIAGDQCEVDNPGDKEVAFREQPV